MKDVSLSESPLGEDGSDMIVAHSCGTQETAKVFLFGAVTKPRIVRIEGNLYIDPRFDGKVALFRIRGHKARKRTTVNGQVGEAKFENCTINGLRYKYIMEQPGGLFDLVNQYYHLSARPSHYLTAKVFSINLDNEEVLAMGRSHRSTIPAYAIIQEDGAPGHGYDNIHDKETTIHADLKYNASTRGIRIAKQCRHSPESNALDLGVWCILKRATENRCEEIPVFDGKNGDLVESATWKVIKDEWEQIDPVKLFIIFEQRRILLDEIINADGQTVKIEPHKGLRAKWKGLRYEPHFVMERLRTIPVQLTM